MWQLNILKERITIKKTPKLGSLKDTVKFVKAITKESSSYQKKLGKGSIKFLLKSTRRGLKVAGLVDPFKEKNETIMGSPDILFEDKKYWVIRYGQPFWRVSPPSNFPTGYTVFDQDNNIITDLEQINKVCKLYQIWERFYVSPLMIPRSKTQIEWIREFKEKFYKEILQRRQKEYFEMKGLDEEKEALKELDEEVFLFHQLDMEFLSLEEQLRELQFELFDRPSDKCIHEFINVVYRFNDLMPLEMEYLDRRIEAWTRFSHLLERKYSVKINLDLNVSHISFAAFIDLIKYVFFQKVIPEAVLSKISFDILKSIGEAKVKEFLLNLIVHYGGLISLEKQVIDHQKMQKTIKNYIKIWESDIPEKILRFS